MSLRGTTLLGRRMSCPTYPLFSPSRGADGSPTCACVGAWRFQFAAGGVNSGRQPWRDLSAGGPHLLSAGDATAKPLRHCLGRNISTATRGTPVARGSLVTRGAFARGAPVAASLPRPRLAIVACKAPGCIPSRASPRQRGARRIHEPRMQRRPFRHALKGVESCDSPSHQATNTLGKT